MGPLQTAKASRCSQKHSLRLCILNTSIAIGSARAQQAGTQPPVYTQRILLVCTIVVNARRPRRKVARAKAPPIKPGAASKLHEHLCSNSVLTSNRKSAHILPVLSNQALRAGDVSLTADIRRSPLCFQVLRGSPEQQGKELPGSPVLRLVRTKQ